MLRSVWDEEMRKAGEENGDKIINSEENLEDFSESICGSRKIRNKGKKNFLKIKLEGDSLNERS
jgi:hypothetical protein